MPVNRQNNPNFFNFNLGNVNLFSNLSGTQTYANATAAANATRASATAAASTPSGTPNVAPPNASAAVKNDPTFTGLCEALNKYQQDLVTAGKQAVADIYEIKFAPTTIADSKVKKPGNTVFANAPLQAQTPTGSELNPATNSVNTSGRTEAIQAGTQIIQFIDKVMRNSSYISDQQLYITDEKTGKQVPNANASNGQMAWFKVSVTSTPLAWDKKRNDFAYRMTYTISTYAINQMQSEYFPKSRFRGLHKVYNYWFTGLNTQVLDFHQEYNNLYRWVLTGSQIKDQETTTSDPRNITRRTVMVASAQSSQGADMQANEPAANAADYLYSPADQGQVKLRIVGDPAWLQQGEITVGVNAQNFNFAPFNPDGTINYEASEITFAISWNQPVDYDFNKGIMNVNGNNVSGTSSFGVAATSGPQNMYAYVAQSVKSTFIKGKFEQELEGKLLTEAYADLQNSPTQNAQKTEPPGTPNQATQVATTPAPAAPVKVADLPIRQQAAIAAGTDVNTVTDSGMAFGGGGL